jgi:hypothetical protein
MNTTAWALNVSLLLVAAGTGPALALDATGTWSGTSICRREAGTTGNGRRESTMLITQRGTTLFVDVDGAAYEGYSLASERQPTRATGTAVRSGDEPVDVMHLDIEVDDVRGTAKITAAMTVPHVRRARHCRYRFLRTNHEDPGVAPPSEPCTPLDVSGHWDGTWTSEVTGQSGQVVADLNHDGDFVYGAISFPPFDGVAYSPPLVRMGICAPAEFSTGAVLESGVVGTLEGTATNTSLAGTWKLSDDSDHGTWRMSR